MLVRTIGIKRHLATEHLILMFPVKINTPLYCMLAGTTGDEPVSPCDILDCVKYTGNTLRGSVSLGADHRSSPRVASPPPELPCAGSLVLVLR